MTKMNVIVHKSISLNKGESLGSFMADLSKACRDHMVQKFNLPTNNSDSSNYSDVWMAEVFDSSVVACVYTTKGGSKYYAFKYERNNKTGQWTFGDTVQVERYTGFRAVSKRASNVVEIKSADGAYWSNR